MGEDTNPSHGEVKHKSPIVVVVGSKKTQFHLVEGGWGYKSISWGSEAQILYSGSGGEQEDTIPFSGGWVRIQIHLMGK